MNQHTADKIFIVDDDPFCLHITGQHLVNMGYSDIHYFENSAECLNNLNLQPDIILLNYIMEMLNGVELLKKIKCYNPDIYVLFSCGEKDTERVTLSLHYGAFDYFVKGENEAAALQHVLKKIINVRELIRKRKKTG